MPEGHDFRSLQRRRVYLGEGLSFEVLRRDRRLDAEAVDLTSEGLGLAITHGDAPAVGERVRVRPVGRGATDTALPALVRHVGRVRDLTRIGLALIGDGSPARDTQFDCPEGQPAFATASCPWFFGEHLRFRIVRAGAEGVTLRAARPAPALLGGMELELDLQFAFAAAVRVRGRVTTVRRPYIGVAWDAPSPALHEALADYLLSADTTLTPARLRAGGVRVGSVERVVSYGYATSAGEHEEILALRLLAHKTSGHLEAASIADLRSPFDAHARHLTCRFGGRIVGYVRVIFVDGEPTRSQYVSWGGHEVPRWLWDAGFVEAGAGAMHPDFQRAGLFVALMQHAVRVAVQSGHRYVLGACDDELLAMYAAMGFELLEERMVEPRPGWRFRSHLIVLDAERLLAAPPATPTLAAMASAAGFAGMRAAA
ncbi:GNAT family N-acetyltransferase [Solirubrobacter ginsenosidimutans]|uniref:GNAT family N-acetyltransferase n=1 Tax=Solirubrobacter ginsenosidimutans TaxID=490573 RepID=A0A9X3S3X3_9ACTN|nr:GNAT family N-acetyltransferase [Solirubrobacter ginsenosidimutans]MDA0160063.1 GNAT family N-acetyltransferase [Solirubrobacter ginsenosidimutans]